MLIPGLTYLCWKASSRRITLVSFVSSFSVNMSMPWHRLLSTATCMSGNFVFIWNGSSPMSSIAVLLSASTYPLLLRLYPRLSTATFVMSFSSLIKYSTCGVLPEPPTVMFPTDITGMSKLRLFRMPSSNIWLRSLTPKPYSQLSGSIHSFILIKSPSIFLRFE